MKCFGYDGQHQPGYGDITSRCIEGSELGDYLPVVDLGTGRTIVTLWGFDNFQCALLDDATLKCWGRNDDGQIGYGDASHRGDNENELGDNLDVVKIGTARTAVSMQGSPHACVLRDDDNFICSEYNPNGQLRRGDTQYQDNE